MAAERSETLVTIKDACQVIDSLNIGMTIPPSLQPPVELHHFSIAYWPNSDQSYENPASIMIALAELNKEIEIQKKVVQYLDEAQEHAKNLYTWRSLMRLFVMGRPNLTERNDENKAALTSCLQVMEPEIRKAFQLYKYHQDAAKFLAGEIYKFSQSLVKGDDSRPGANKNFYSETCLVTMGKMLGSFVALDNLICFNAAFRNDFAEYNRTLIKAKNAGVAPNNVEEDQKLGEMKMFFAQKTPLQDALFKYLQELDQQAGVGSGLIINFFKKLILTCADNFGKGKFVMPSEKEDYLKIISCCLKFIMRSEKKFESNNQIFSKCFKDEEKKQIIRCFKSISVLKDFGDVPIDENQLLFDMTGKGSDKQNSLHERLQEFERDHGTIVCRIMDLVRNYNLMTERAMRLQADDEFENYLDNAAKQWYDVAVRALKCLENITGAILSLYAWKLCHGKALDDDTITSYSKVTRYNYDAEEKTDMTIAIGLAKGLQNVMIKYEEIFSFLIGRHCFSRLHDVIDRVIPELADKIKDKHRMTCRMFIDTLVKVAKKFKNPYRIPNAHSSMASSGNKKSGGKKGGAAPQPEADPSPVGAVGPGNTQLYMIRSMLEWLCSSDQIKLYKRAPDLSAALRDFHEETFHWSYVLNLTSIIPKAGDMSIMWFRESYLTMEVAKANPDPQFGLNESMPWILAEHLLESDTGAGALIEHCLIPFELYNDSAEAVLKFFRKQHLFDELEAETSLGFEQLINWLYTHVFENTIERALFQYAVSHAPKQLRSSGLGEPRKLNCAWLLQQSNIIMLGQTIDLRERLVSRFAAMLREELATIFVRFKNSSYSFTYIWEAFTKIEIMRVAHSFLIEDIALPDFDTLVVEAKATALSDNQSFFHLMVKKLEFSVFPMFNFDLASGSGYLNPDLWRSLTSYKNEEGKWICPPVPEYKLRAANKKATFCVNASEYTEKLFTKVVAPVFAHKFYTLTDEHYRALVKLLSLEEIALLVKECSRVIIDNFAKTEVSGMFSTQPIPSVLFTLLQLRSGMKSSECKLQPNLVQTKAQIVRIHESFCPIILYQDFDYLIEGLTEVGNGMIFLYHLEKIVNTEEARNNVASAMFTNRFNQQKFINLIGRGRFMEIKKMNIAKLGRDPDPETERRIEQHANESTTGYVHLKVDLMNRSNIFNYIDPEQSRLPSLLQETLSVPETTSSFFGKLLFDLQQTLLRNPIFNFFDLTCDQPASLNPGTDLFIGLNQSEVIQFHWLWSAIVFAMAKPKPEKREPIPKSIKQQYSDGVTLAGSALISLLGQVGRFKCYDLCTFIKTIHEIENLDVKNENMPTGLEYFDLSKRGEEINLGTYVSRAEEISAVNHSNLLFLTSCMGAYGVPQGLPYGQNGVEAFIPPLETEESN